MSKKVKDSIQGEIADKGCFHRGGVPQMDLDIVTRAASALNEPIHYVANTDNSDYTVTIGKKN